MKTSRLAVLGTLVLVAACSDRATNRSPTAPGVAFDYTAPNGCADADSVRFLIQQAFPKAMQNSARSRYDQLSREYRKGDAAASQHHAMQLVDYILSKYRAGVLAGGQSNATQATTIALLNGVLCASGLPQSFLPGALGNDNAAAVIYPTTPDTVVVTGTLTSGVLVPQGSVTVPTVVQITRLPDSPGPLNTPFDQYPLYYQFTVTPSQTFVQDVTIGACLANSATPPDPTRLRVAHNVSAGGIEIAPLAAAPFVDCTNADIGALGASTWRQLARGGSRLLDRALEVLSPAPLYARTRFAGGGIGGTVRSFSPFGLVDTLAIMTRASEEEPRVPDVLPPPAVVLTTPTGRPMAGVSVQFSIVQYGGILNGGNAVSDANGLAAATGWSLNGANYSFVQGTASAPTGAGFVNSPMMWYGVKFPR